MLFLSIKIFLYSQYMKKRRGALLTFLFCACVGLGVGYAALTDSFSIHGDIGANKDNENLVCVFDGETANSTIVSTVDGTHCQWATENGASAIDGRTDCELKFTGLTTKDQVASAKLVVENRSIEDASLTATLSAPDVVHHLDPSVFQVTVKWEGDEANPVIAPRAYATLSIEVKMLTTPTTAIDASAFSVSFTATTN